MRTHSRSRWLVAAPLLSALLAVLILAPAGARPPGLRVLILGGGPEPEHNQVAIERNVYYVSHLLPPAAPRWILFADGDPAGKTVLFETEPLRLAPAERAFALLFGSREDASPSTQRFRAPALGRLDGPARRAAVARAFDGLRRGDPDPVLVYFTGHGSQARDRNPDNNSFDLWQGEHLPVRDLAAHIATLPPEVPVTLVMVQCFAGAFGNLVFAGGDPKAPPVERQIAGFFAAPRDRPAAGCTPEVNEAEYHDFTSYFFAALTGRDRVGRPVSGADYNRDGRVGMDEAFAYSLIHDVSIDVPVCTSDVFLYWVVPATEDEVFQTRYSQARAWATPAQAAALDELSRALRLTGEGRLEEVRRMMVSGSRQGASQALMQARRRFRQTREEARRWLLARWPELRAPQAGDRRGTSYAAARAQVVAELGRRMQDGWLQDVLAADQALTQAEDRSLQAEIDEARVLRFARLARSIVLAHRLRASGEPALRQRFERLIAAEARPLL
jgi:hypothetical protein